MQVDLYNGRKTVVVLVCKQLYNKNNNKSRN